MKNAFAAIITPALATAALALSTLAIPTLASAQDHAIAADGGMIQAHVTAQRAKKHGWLTTMGPDAQGRYTVSIDVADLDTNSAAGHAKLASRVEWAASILCDMTGADGTATAGYYDAGTRTCRDETRTTAMARLNGGQHASMLTLGTRTVAR
ncbi:UrcA family protein [Novosphingobium sp.]|uniref:UrcA family protein n=1 Tax=Novosphingobium sp. TaxID=1874826 RepID=UPI0025D9064D|nr:UrcA family protein [Novosphingobium sp.]